MCNREGDRAQHSFNVDWLFIYVLTLQHISSVVLYTCLYLSEPLFSHSLNEQENISTHFQKLSKHESVNDSRLSLF